MNYSQTDKKRKYLEEDIASKIEELTNYLEKSEKS